MGKFKKSLLLTKSGQPRLRFPQSEATLFAERLTSVLSEVKASTGINDKVAKCERLAHATQILARSCSGIEGIDAFDIVLETLMDLWVTVIEQENVISAQLAKNARLEECIEQLQVAISDCEGSATALPNSPSDLVEKLSAVTFDERSNHLDFLSSVTSNPEKFFNRACDIIESGEFRSKFSLAYNFEGPTFTLFVLNKDISSFDAEVAEIKKLMYPYEVLVSTKSIKYLYFTTSKSSFVLQK